LAVRAKALGNQKQSISPKAKVDTHQKYPFQHPNTVTFFYLYSLFYSKEFRSQRKLSRSMFWG